MRVLLAPEVYRPDDLSANGTVADAATWVEQWLALDPSLHVYWLLPPRADADYEDADVYADRDRVTLVEAEPPMHGTPREELFTEGGYSSDQLRALERAIFEQDAYVDVVVDGHRTGRATLYKWLLQHVDQWAADVRPFDVVAHVHDMQLPFKHRYCDYRNRYQFQLEVCGAAFADGRWFKAGVDADEFRSRATEFLRERVVDDALADAVETGSPIDCSQFEASYADEPRTFHVAGSLWSKKHTDVLLDAGRALHERFDVRTLLTTMEALPPDFDAPDWVDVRANADRETYEAALAEGDLAVCASDYETMPRTPFEQAASGQVLVLRDEPWIYDCVPDDYPLVGDRDELTSLAVAAVERWDDAVAANRRLVEHVRGVRSPERSGRRTYDDLRRRVEVKRDRFEKPAVRQLVEAALADVDWSDDADGPDGGNRSESSGESDGVILTDLLDAMAAHAGDRSVSTEREDEALTDVVYALRSLGYEDAGNPGTPRFRAVDGDGRPGSE